MPKEYGYSAIINPSRHGTDTEAFIISALRHEHIVKWAYIFRDKECYDEHDIGAYRFDLMRTWADGFRGMEEYSSQDEFIEKRMQDCPQIGDSKESLWHVVIITDKPLTTDTVVRLFDASAGSVRSLKYRIDIAEAIKSLAGEDIFSEAAGRHHYSDDEIISNFDFREYLASAARTAKWDLFRKNFDPAMIFGLCLFAFVIAAAIKLGTTAQNTWLIAGIVGGIGMLYLIGNLYAMRVSKKKNRHVSGIPFVGGVHLLIAGLISPVKFLAILCLLDFTIWSFIYELYRSLRRD